LTVKAATKQIIEEAASLLQNGKLVAFPTETVYGLAADACNDAAVAEIFAAKGRPSFNPLIIHFADFAAAKEFVIWNERAEILANKFPAAPLTLILPRKPNCKISLLASAGGDTIGVRVPANDIARALCQAAATPLAAPSANRSGRVSPTTAAHVQSEFGDNILIIDGGNCDIGIESSVIDLSGEYPVLLRPGFIASEELSQILGEPVLSLAQHSGTLKSPGMLTSHYAPSLPVILNVEEVDASQALLAFGDNIPDGAKFTLNLSEQADLTQAASNLFAYLRQLDNPAFSAICVMPIPNTGLGVAINDRLQRAAAK